MAPRPLGHWSAARPSGRSDSTKQGRKRIGDEWALSALEIEAQIRSYFPRSVVASWEVYAWIVDRFIDAHHVSAGAALQDAVTSQVRLDAHVSDAAAALLVLGENTSARCRVRRRQSNRQGERSSAREDAVLRHYALQGGT